MDMSSSNRPDSIHGLLKTHMFEPFSNQEHTHPPVQPRAVRRGATAGCVQGNLEGPGFDVHYRCSMGHEAPSRTSESVLHLSGSIHITQIEVRWPVFHAHV